MSYCACFVLFVALLRTHAPSPNERNVSTQFREGEASSARVRMLRAEKEQRFQERKVERAELAEYIRAQLESAAAGTAAVTATRIASSIRVADLLLRSS